MSTTLFAPLERVVAKYKHDVNRLASPASPAAVSSLEGHLGLTLPPGLRVFLERYNGAQLLRGALNIRTASSIAKASDVAATVVLFADGQGDTWAWSQNGQGGYAFGRWVDGSLVPQHCTFAGWLRASLAVVEARVTRERDRVALRFEADRDDPYQLLHAGVRALRQGNPDPARGYLQTAARHSAGAVGAWQRLGDALAVEDRSAARNAWLQAFHNQRFPRAFPGAPCLDPDVFRSIGGAFSDKEDYERELARFLDEQVDDVRDNVEGEVVVAAATALSRSAERRGRRGLARKALSDLIGRCRLYTWQQVPWNAVLDLARLEVELGNHDEAEALLRRVRRDGPDDLAVRGELLLGRIAVTREEPWAEQILQGVLLTDADDSDRFDAATLLAERSIRRDRLDDAKKWVDRASGVAKKLGVAPLIARSEMARGDLARANGDPEVASACYASAIKHLNRQDEPEVRFRVLLRTGDLALAAGQPESAHQQFRTAVEGFAAHELPVREAWALIRLARLTPDNQGLLKAARQRFEHADLAAGISAVDAVSGDPGASLDWHVHRATAQARARYDAQRSRPPWERSDADRPERRLGAHRVAIAACDSAVVERLSGELAACARAMATGRMRAVDAPVLRYVAAVDLLAGHRSFRAAQVLLEHLVQQRVTGPARRALQAAVARSPNAALVDGLLRCIETPSKHPASVVAEAAEVLGLRREPSALRALAALADRMANPMSRKAAIIALARTGERTAVEAIVPALGDPVLEEAASLALLMLGDRRGIDFHARALTENRLGLTVSPGEIVGRYGGPSHLLLLINATAAADEGALGALQGLGLLGDPRAMPTLLEGLDRRDRRFQEVAAGAMQILTGHSEKLDDPGWKARWHVWWERNAADFPEGVRHRDGQIFHLGMLLERMHHPDPWTRRTAHDELVITSGRNLPFDADGPWRVQQAHLKEWRVWWTDARTWLHSGRWYLDGKPVL